MTSKLTITDERLAELVAFKPLPGTDINSATRDEWMAMAAELQERRKADMNSEPYGFTDGDRRGMIYKPEHADRLNEPLPVYRHAQPASVVPDALIKAVDFYKQVKREIPPVETGAWKDAVEWVLKEACQAVIKDE